MGLWALIGIQADGENLVDLREIKCFWRATMVGWWCW
jgi:hypothetical protein